MVSGNSSRFDFLRMPLGIPNGRNPFKHNPRKCHPADPCPFCRNETDLRVGAVQSQLDAPSLPLPMFLALNHTVRPYKEVDSETLLTSALKYLSLSKEVVQEWYHWQDEAGHVHLELYATVALEALSLEELRYLYYQQLLQEQVANVKDQLMRMVHEVTSVKKTRKLVQDQQRGLIVLSEQVLEQLTAPAREAYALSGQYTLPDVHKLIFQRIEELLLFLEQQFGTYLETAALVPYQRCQQAHQELIPLIHQINKVLSSSSVPAELVAVLDEPFNEIHNISLGSVTYQQLYYFQQLVQNLAQLTQQPIQPTEEALIATLLQVNFNSPALVHYVIDDLTDQMSATESPQEARQLLRQAQQKYQQWIGIEDRATQSGTRQSGTMQSNAYRPGYPPVHQQVLRWIDDELVYQGKEVPTATETPDQHQTKKVKISLTVPQIALWLRLGSEVGIFPKQDITNMCRQFSRILHSVGQEALSGGSLRGKYYEYDARSIALLKDKVIAMLNYLNQLSKEDR